MIFREGDLRGCFRAGPFGYPSIAAHAHCDQLSIILIDGEEELLTDSGTFCYHEDDFWRRYFKGTAAHNTVRVDQTDQAEYGGPFLWSTQATGRLHQIAEREFEGAHDGYRRLADPVTHLRRVTLPSSDRLLQVADTLSGLGKPHGYELIWNFGQYVGLGVAIGNRITLTTPSGKRFSMEIESSLPYTIATFYGDELAPAGFYSRQFGQKSPIHQLRAKARGQNWSVTTSLRRLP
ncbi:MAG: heparinase II/III-family protein [Armatimonadetes bacterium]|nr:heparinase II/III-family protein [Armatimonadota bacterium]